MNRRYTQFGYSVAVLLILLPALDLGANVWPWNLGNAGWRYGSYGIMSGFLLSPLVGLAVALATALGSRHRKVRKTLAAIAGLLGIVIAAVSVLYGLDAIEIRASIPAEARQQFAIGTVKALAKNLIGALTALWFAWLGWKSRSASGSSA